MNISRRTLIGTVGSLLGVGDKVGVLEGLARVSNQTRRVFDLWLHTGRPDGFATEVIFLPFSDIRVAVTDILVYSHYLDTRQGALAER